MKNIFNFFLICTVVILFFSIDGNAQQNVRIVKVGPNVVDTLYNAIHADSAARVNALPTKTIYELQRGGVYPNVTTIQNENPFFYLYIRAEPGNGPRPLIVPAPGADGGYDPFLKFRASGKLENLVFDDAQPTGGYQTRSISAYNGATVEFDSCIIRHDRAAALTFYSDSCTFIVKDCIIHSMGGRKSYGDNGRPFEIRAGNFFNKVFCQNTTIFDISDRMFRNNGTEADSVVFDHCTIINTGGFHGGMQAGPIHNLIVTNCLWYNNILWGSRATEPGVLLGSQPEKDRLYVLSIDTVFGDGKLEIRNNDIYWDQEYKDLWASIDTIGAPGAVTPTIMNALGADSSNAYFSEQLQFTIPVPSWYDFVSGCLMDRTNIDQPENFYYSPEDSIDLSYQPTAKSYTAADNGYPLGDLNWYPDLKTKWESGEILAVDDGTALPTEFSLKQNYPNPFNPTTTITYTISHNSNVKLEVINILGQKVATLINKEQPAGEHKVNFDAANLSSGVYFYNLTASGKTITKKMMLLK
jgi:Secretion system C-terminal sorting domain